MKSRCLPLGRLTSTPPHELDSPTHNNMIHMFPPSSHNRGSLGGPSQTTLYDLASLLWSGILSPCPCGLSICNHDFDTSHRSQPCPCESNMHADSKPTPRLDLLIRRWISPRASDNHHTWPNNVHPTFRHDTHTPLLRFTHHVAWLRSSAFLWFSGSPGCGPAVPAAINM